MPSSKSNPGQRYRLLSQVQERQNEGVYVAQKQPWLESIDKTESKKQKYKGFGRGWWILTVVSVLAFVALFVITSYSSSFRSTGAVTLIALVPLLAVTGILGTIDKWAPLGWGYKILGFLWGAGIAAILAVGVNTGLHSDLLHYTGNPDKSELIAATIIAPIGEELFKGIGVVVLLVMARHRLTSTLSSFAFAGLVGAGFAYTENISYFVQAAAEGTGMLTRIIIARGILSPFVHPMATSFMGWAVGSALLRRPNFVGWVWRLCLGFLVAITIHAGWNSMAAFGGAFWFILYLIIGIPAFATWLVGMIVWSRRLARRVQFGLNAYVVSGWISEAETAMATNKFAYKYSRRWAKSIGAPAPKMVRAFVRSLRHLGLDQSLMSDHGPVETRIETDRVLLSEIVATRNEFSYLAKTRGQWS